MKTATALPTLSFKTPRAWASWLKKYHLKSPGLWLKLAKKSSGLSSVSHPQALEVALCHGWIDGQGASFDDCHWLIKFTPRRPKSLWSKNNCAKAETLLAAGKMQPAGIKQMELAKADGRWASAYEPQRRMTVPEDFKKALNKNRQAAAFFKTLNSANRYAYLWRIHTAKKPETRAARMKQFIQMLSAGQKLHP